jgi:CheY-like chemotaxis protein
MTDAIRILLAEDNHGDEFLVREALREHQVQHELHVMRDGLEAVHYIERMGDATDAPCPDVLLLDLNLPHRSGHELLQLFRAHPFCRNTPVIVITSSDAEKDRRRAAELGATRYFRKPSDVDEFIQLGAIVREVVSAA